MLQAIADEGSFAAAARALGLVPSALTYRVRQIEDALDVLLFDRSALDNVLLPLQIAGLPRREAIRRASAALDKVGLLAREKANPIALSGGEQQRLAIARAVVNRPTVLLADEPTGNLDSGSAADILEIFAEFHQVGVTVVVATHDQSWIERYHPNVLRLDHGRLVA